MTSPCLQHYKARGKEAAPGLPWKTNVQRLQREKKMIVQCENKMTLQREKKKLGVLLLDAH